MHAPPSAPFSVFLLHRRAGLSISSVDVYRLVAAASLDASLSAAFDLQPEACQGGLGLSPLSPTRLATVHHAEWPVDLNSKIRVRGIAH